MLVMLTIIPCERTNEVNVTPAIGRIHSLNQLPTNMREGCRVALSGTPGTGKTTISSLLQSEGFDVLSLEKIADKHNCLGELDATDDSKEIILYPFLSSKDATVVFPVPGVPLSASLNALPTFLGY